MPGREGIHKDTKIKAAVWKRMDEHEPVIEADGDFVG